MITKYEHSEFGDYAEVNAMYEQLGKVIKKYRLMVGMSQKDLAEGICGKSYITLIENGHRCPNVIILFLLCNRLKVPIDLLFQTICRLDAESNMKNDLKVYAGLRRMDYLSGAKHANLDETVLVRLKSYELDGADVFVKRLRGEKFSDIDEDEFNSFKHARSVLSNRQSEDGGIFCSLYDLFCLSDWLLLMIFAGRSPEIYDQLLRYIAALDKQELVEEYTIQMRVILDFEMALVCNDLGHLTESNYYIEKGLKESKTYSVSAIIPQLYYAKGEVAFLQGDKFMAKAYIAKAMELHEIIHADEDDFPIVRIRAGQKGIEIK